jgi:hydrogenase expression/formation protein HypC
MGEPECTGEVCITCGDVAVPVRIVELRADRLALVDTGTGPGSQEEISVALVDAAVGDMVLAHAGEAIAVLPGGRRTDTEHMENRAAR